MEPYRHRVLYGDTDQMGVVYYANYLRFFEGARGEWIRTLGLSYAEIEERGIFLPVLEVGVRYLKPARYDDVLEIPMVVSHTRVKVRFEYKIYRQGSPDALILGHTVHACVNREGRPTRAPDWLVKAMEGASTLHVRLPQEESGSARDGRRPAGRSTGGERALPASPVANARSPQYTEGNPK